MLTRNLARSAELAHHILKQLIVLGHLRQQLHIRLQLVKHAVHKLVLVFHDCYRSSVAVQILGQSA
ncbi:hypothetical protein D3C73_1550780 [compost metagenome]